MEIRIITRHTSINDSLRERARERVEQLSRYEPRMTSAEVCFHADHGACRVEIRTQGTGGSTIVAHGSGANFRAALDAAADRIARQLRRRRERMISRRSVASSARA